MTSPHPINALLPYQPYFSVLIVSWNSTQYVPDCLASLANQSFQDFEVFLLDNGSDSPMPESIVNEFPTLKLSLLRSVENLGFAGGNNHLASLAKGRYLALLNADAFPEPDWLEIIHDATTRYPRSFFASRLISASKPDILDGEWNVYHASGLAWRRNHNKSVARATVHERFVFSTCAAAGVYPREAFKEVNGFDDDFFAYMEDLDLDFRLQLAGYSCVYMPSAVVRHVGAGSTKSRSGFMLHHGHRNLVWVFFKDMPGFLFWALLPLHFLVNIVYFCLSFFMKNGTDIRRGKREALQGLAAVWAKRKLIQTNRKVSVHSIASLLDWNPFSPLIKLTYK